MGLHSVRVLDFDQPARSNTALQQPGAYVANRIVALGAKALLRNEGLSTSITAPAAERHIR